MSRISTHGIFWLDERISLEALEKHKEEPLHVEAAKKERNISKCSLCKKQFTSPPQLQVLVVFAPALFVATLPLCCLRTVSWLT